MHCWASKRPVGTIEGPCELRAGLSFACRHRVLAGLLGAEADGAPPADVSGDELTIGSNVVYAKRRQLGGGSKGRDPARPFLGVSDADKQFINDAVAEFLARN